MSKTIVQINFHFSSSLPEYTALVTPLADPIAAMPGLGWKIWLMNEVDREAGGIYLFESREAAQAYVSSEIIKALGAHPMISNVSVKMFEPDETLSKVTHGPLMIAARA
jgi:hypothetical protein